jgi:hypothetical protein
MRKTCKALAVLPFALYLAPLSAQAQTACATSSLNGSYFYVLTGNVYVSSAGYFVPYAELGQFTADGNGGITGQSTNNAVGFNLSSSNLSGSYAVQANCTGNIALNTEAFSIQVIGSGQTVLLSPSTANFAVNGQAYRATASGQCGNGSLNGTYSYLQSGGFSASTATGTAYYSEVGQMTLDGNGNLTTANIYNAGVGGTSETATGTYTLNSNCSGTAQISYGGTTGTLGYNIALAGTNLLLLETDSSDAIAGAGQRQSIGSVLPQFVFGANTWYSALYFTNTNSNSVTFAVNFTADGGTPLTVPSIGGSSTTVTIAPNGTYVLEAPRSGTFGQGFASVVLPAGVTGYGIFRQSVAGRPDQEAVVPLASATSTTNTLAWDETVGTVTVAIANPSSVAANVTINVWDTSGNLLGTSQPIPIGATSKIAGALDALAGINLVGKRGSAQFTVSTGNVAVLGLRFSGVAFTSVPAAGN